jgi:FkbM family methyltransferase
MLLALLGACLSADSAALYQPRARPNCTEQLAAHASLRLHRGQTTLGIFPMALRNGDFPSLRIRGRGFWEIHHPDNLTSLAAPSLPLDELAEPLRSQFQPRPSEVPGHMGLFIDIGAHIGWYSFVFAQAGWHVLALEPMPANRAAITATRCLNPQFAEQRITLVPTAISVNTATCVLRSWSEGDGNGQLDCTPGAECRDTRAGYHCTRHACACTSINSTSLDDILSEHVPHRRRYRTIVAKVDVEAAECDVFAGGQTLFTRLQADFVQVEGLQEATRQCIRREAERHGYGIGERFGHDNNTVLFRPAARQKYVEARREGIE